MKALMAAMGLLAVTATMASAQYYGGPRGPGVSGGYSSTYGGPPAWSRDRHPYAQRHHATCQEKAWRLRNYERRSGADGTLSFRELQIRLQLRRDLDRTCGRFRWRD